MDSRGFNRMWMVAMAMAGCCTVNGVAQTSLDAGNNKIQVKEMTVPRSEVVMADKQQIRKAKEYFAATKAEGRKTLFVNKDVTTFIVTGDFIQLMDISVPGKTVTGNQPGENIVRIKPIEDANEGQDMGVVTIICERSIIQFNLVYTHDRGLVTTQYNCDDTDGVSYLNPAVDMSYKQMYQYAWAIMNSTKKFYDVSSSAHKMYIKLNNIYTTGNYFFFDFSMENKSNIKFDIEEIRVKLGDKKQVKATNSQEMELTPVLILNKDKSFKRDYRNIVVLPKFTFPDEKILSITVSEKQISGRTVTLEIDYNEVLNADAFHSSLIQ